MKHLKIPLYWLLFCFIPTPIWGLVDGQIHVGLLDIADKDQSRIVNQQTRYDSDFNYFGFGIKNITIQIKQDISELVSIDIQPYWSAPDNLSEMGFNTAFKNTLSPTSSAMAFSGFQKATISITLHSGITVSAGILKPRFSWDYSEGLYFWEDALPALFTTSPYLGAIKDTGLEITKTVELGFVTIPVYAYLLNGTVIENDTLIETSRDNNHYPSILLRFEPQWEMFRFAAAYYSSLYSSRRYSLGMIYQVGSFYARAEYTSGTWDHKLPGNVHYNPLGFYVKGLYRVSSWFRLGGRFCRMEHNNIPNFERYDTVSPLINFYISENSVLHLQADFHYWQQNTPTAQETIQFKRFYIGWQTSFL